MVERANGKCKETSFLRPRKGMRCQSTKLSISTKWMRILLSYWWLYMQVVMKSLRLTNDSNEYWLTWFDHQRTVEKAFVPTSDLVIQERFQFDIDVLSLQLRDIRRTWSSTPTMQDRRRFEEKISNSSLTLSHVKYRWERQSLTNWLSSKEITWPNILIRLFLHSPWFSESWLVIKGRLIGWKSFGFCSWEWTPIVCLILTMVDDEP